MTVVFRGRTYKFRKCDTQNITQYELQNAADKRGYMAYERKGAWLIIPDIGYGWEV